MRYTARAVDMLRQIQVAAELERQHWAMLAQEINAWRMFGLAVEQAADEIIISNPNQSENLK